ncbi:hypothetical protein GCM10027169_16100 [Gordonia jinhuaensis]|uniref:DUF6924 domain-containing protein n=1 Tax=Gordonia jinhuaensis TaxID=1517702 RepID=A0A916TJX7_9ACTN|nr:hypothetical protein [Gordonia jinhuaensis]GGB48690.1 hypothetical protein GCM10011489_39750 [Gordonia jinhuaensis]
MAITLPAPVLDFSVLIRSDFSDDDVWEEVREAAVAEVWETPSEPFVADLTVVDDDAFDKVSVNDFVSAAEGSDHSVVFVADAKTMSDPDHPILAIDTSEEPGATFRVVPSSMWAVQNNVALGNLFFSELAEQARQTSDNTIR